MVFSFVPFLQISRKITNSSKGHRLFATSGGKKIGTASRYLESFFLEVVNSRAWKAPRALKPRSPQSSGLKIMTGAYHICIPKLRNVQKEKISSDLLGIQIKGKRYIPCKLLKKRKM